jgi:hypothetical protein
MSAARVLAGIEPASTLAVRDPAVRSRQVTAFDVRRLWLPGVTAARRLGCARLMAWASAWRAADGLVHEHGVPAHERGVPAATAVKTPALAAVSWVLAGAPGGWAAPPHGPAGCCGRWHER